MVAERDGLRALQMRIPRQDGRLVRLCLRGDGREQLLHERDDLLRLAAHVHAQVERHLIVAAARGVELFSYIAHALGQHLLDEHVDVLAAHVEFQRAGIQIVQNPLQRVDERRRVLLRNDALCAEHRRVRHAALDILPVHFTVKPDGRVEIIRNRIGYAGGPAGP